MNTEHPHRNGPHPVTRERIRQTAAKAFRKLGHQTRNEQLRSFLMED